MLQLLKIRDKLFWVRTEKGWKARGRHNKRYEIHSCERPGYFRMCVNGKFFTRIRFFNDEPVEPSEFNSTLKNMQNWAQRMYEKTVKHIEANSAQPMTPEGEQAKQQNALENIRKDTPRKILVERTDLLQWAKDWQEENAPKDGTDIVTPFDKYLY